MSERLIDWHGCYKKTWVGNLHPPAFAHPAKAAFGLAERIYEHAIEQRWLKEGDTVLDPFAGIAGFAFHALASGLNWIGVELEEKFVSLGQQNIDLWNRRYSALPRWGSAVILQGDSRNLVAVLDGAPAQGLVASPPYARSEVQQSHGRSWREELSEVTGSWRKAGIGYGDQQANLGNMREGDHAATVRAVVSSPPYACSFSGEKENPEKTRERMRRKGHSTESIAKVGDFGHSAGLGYSTNPTNLGNMPEGSHQAVVNGVIASPPYTGVEGFHDKGFSDRWGPKQSRTTVPAGYGSTPGQLAAMPEGVAGVVSSPPWENALSRDVVDKDERRRWAREHGVSNAEYVSPVDMERVGCRDQEYGTTAGQLGNSQGDTFWSAAKIILQQCYQVLAPGAIAVWVLKAFVRNREIVDFPGQWQALCEACGFETVEVIRAWLVEDRGAQYALNGDLEEKRVARKSFFRRLAESKGSPPIDYEIVLVTRKV